MNPQTPAESLFYQALELSSEELSAFLDEACSADPALRAEVEELFQAYGKSDGFLTRDGALAGLNLPVRCASWRQQDPQQVGEHIGPYKLMEQIGEGGFGTVWVAEQEHPIRRRVALKIIKLGMDTKEVVARFEQERQALALMDHPNISKVLDAGATPTGRPFFVMELVTGIKITDYCDEARLATRERLKLFIQVCSAVQHAHQKGIIHRDLKPSNILVTLHDGIPVPKVIDFGVAKATQQQRLTDLTIYTQFEQMVGTPLYMAPEQAEMSGLDIDTRSDIYSLGVLLYELLAGRTPFDPESLMRRGLDEIRRVIREEEPLKPSTFVSTMALELRANVAKHRNLEGAKLISSIKGDLDWIVMKALEKDRNRRYETASSFAQDIERHLSSEPVQARPPSPAYRFRRFVRRNRTTVGAGAVVGFVLLVGVAGVVWQAIRAQRGETAATAALAELRASAPVFADQARSLVDKDRFNEALEKLDTAIKLRPDVVDYVLSKANLLQAQLRFAEAADVYRTALRLTPAGERTSANAALCDTLAAEMAAKGKPSRGSLAHLASAMEKEGRPTAERIRIERLLGEEKKLLVDYWLKRLKDLSLPPEYPLEKQLTLGESGQLQLALTGTPITDLSPLAGMPLETLILSGSKNIKDLSPLRGMPLRELSLGAMTREGEYYAPCEISDLSALRGLPLKSLNLAGMLVSDLAPLQGIPLETLDLSGTAVRDVTALKGMPLRQLYCNETPVLDFSPVIGAPLEVLSLQNSKVSDISFLRELPIKVLLLDGANEARGLRVLTEMGNLELLTLSRWLVQWPDEEMAAVDRLRRSEKLRGIQFGPPAWAESGISTREPAEFWREFDDLARMRKSTVTVASLARAGRFREAAEVTRAQLAPEGDSTNCMLLCIELAAAGDLKGYRAACDEMLRRFAHPNRADEAERTLRCVLLLPQEGLDKTVFARLTEYVRTEKATAWDELAAGLSDYRASRLDSAADWLVRCCSRAVVSNRCKSAASAVLAMTEYRRGNVEAAKTALASSRSMISAQWPNGDELNWHAWLMADILCREAEALIR